MERVRTKGGARRKKSREKNIGKKNIFVGAGNGIAVESEAR
jgi:hypothetical protein